MCSVNPDNVDMLFNFGIFTLGAGVVSFLTGTTYIDVKKASLREMMSPLTIGLTRYFYSY